MAKADWLRKAQQELRVEAEQAGRLVGFAFRNHYCSHAVVELQVANGAGEMCVIAEPLRVTLNEEPHTQDRAQDWHEVDLTPTTRRAIAAASGPLIAKFSLAQSSPVWAHKRLALEHLEPRFEPPAAPPAAPAPAPAASPAADSVEDHGDRMDNIGAFGRLQRASDQLALHLGVLETLQMRKRRLQGSLAQPAESS